MFDRVFNNLYNEKYVMANNRMTQILQAIANGFKIENINEWLYKIEPVLVMESGITYTDLKELSWRQIYAHYEAYADKVKRENERIKRENAQAEKEQKKAERERKRAESKYKQLNLKK